MPPARPQRLYQAHGVTVRGGIKKNECRYRNGAGSCRDSSAGLERDADTSVSSEKVFREEVVLAVHFIPPFMI